MKRNIVLGVLLGVASLSLVVAAQQQAGRGGQPAPKVVEVEKLKDNLFVLKGGGGNTAVFITASGVVVVDAKNPGWGQPILDKIKELTNKPVTTLINTHTHGDHVSGNVEFPATIDIIVQENTKTNMVKMIPNSTAADQTIPPQTIFQANNGRGLPKRTFKDKMTLFKGPDEIDLFYFGRGHTNGDAWVLFPALRIVHAGDIFSGKNLPLLDANNGGSAALIGESLQKGYDALKNVSRILQRRGGGEKSGQERGRHRGELEAARKIFRLRPCRRESPEEQCEIGLYRIGWQEQLTAPPGNEKRGLKPATTLVRT